MGLLPKVEQNMPKINRESMNIKSNQPSMYQNCFNIRHWGPLGGVPGRTIVASKVLGRTPSPSKVSGRTPCRVQKLGSNSCRVRGPRSDLCRFQRFRLDPRRNQDLGSNPFRVQGLGSDPLSRPRFQVGSLQKTH